MENRTTVQQQTATALAEFQGLKEGIFEAGIKHGLPASTFEASWQSGEWEPFIGQVSRIMVAEMRERMKNGLLILSCN